MSSSLRARRMARNHKRLKQQTKLNLVALMDIFTILVLFLMVNNGDVEVLQSDRNITLPESVSEQKPETTLIIKVTATDILVQGRSIETMEQALAQQGNSLAALGQELRYQSSRSPALSALQQPAGRPVIIMGDQGMPYKVLKRIMSTCAETDYRDISLAVNSNPPSPAEQPLFAAAGGGL
jgi:biopolymer transport protein ExbD